MKRLISKIRSLIQNSGFLERGCQSVKTIPTLTQPHAHLCTTRKSTTKSASHFTQATSTIEKLPPELRHQVLCLLDLNGLRSLTQASPVFLQQYLASRNGILLQCLDRSLGSTGLDAYWAYQTSQPKFMQGLTPGRIENFNKIYEHQRSAHSCSLLDQELAETDINRLAAFHCFVIDPMQQLFSQQALQNLAEEAGNPPSDSPFSEVEQTRLLRAFYRYQITCNLLAHGKFGRSQLSTEESWSGRILANYVCVFEPWEIEEIACVYAFAKALFGQIFAALNGVKRCQLEQSSKYIQDLLEGTTCQGLVLLHTALCTSKDINQLASIMQNAMTDTRNTIHGDILSQSAQNFRRRARFTDRDWKEQRREEMLFDGDSETKPSLGWTSIWDGTYSNMYGNVIPDELRRWGYVMWDVTRMQHSGATEVLKRQWDLVWANEDPRYWGL